MVEAVEGSLEKWDFRRLMDYVNGFTVSQDTWSVSKGRVLTAFDLSEFQVICDVRR
ncbi:hypothetical protein LEMLEM_LOCUS18261 [Lemmus lemmus]